MIEVDTKEPLEVVARQIEAHARKSDEHIISAAMLMREARRRVDSGDCLHIGPPFDWTCAAREAFLPETGWQVPWKTMIASSCGGCSWRQRN